MRVLVVHTEYRIRGGEDEAVKREVELLQSNGHTVLMLLFENIGNPAASSVALVRSSHNSASEKRLRASIREFQPDVVHFHNLWFAGSYSLPAVAKGLRIPVISSLHNYRHICVSGDFFRNGKICTDCLSGSLGNAVMHRCYRNSVVASTVGVVNVKKGRRGAGVADVSERVLVLSATAMALHLRAGVPREKLARVNNFVEAPPPRKEVPSKSRSFLFVGRDSPEKGLGLLLEAWAIFRSSYPDFELLLAGVDSRKPLPSGVRGLGVVSHEIVSQLMNAARSLVFPSLCFENQPLVVIEAFAAALPVITLAGNSAAELMGCPAAGIVVPSADPLEFSKGLVKLSLDKEVDGMSRESSRIYASCHTPEAKILEMERIYRGAVDGGAA